MQVMNVSFPQKLVVLGTGGTIAGLAQDALDNVGYKAAQVGVEQLLAALPKGGCGHMTLVSEQVAQVDSKDMDLALWQRLAQRCVCWLSDPQVKGIVITHGTDTMEETAYFLHTVLARDGCSDKPVVLTGAMRPASALAPDGPQNMLDALAVATDPSARGVMVVFGGNIHGAVDVQKVHGYRQDAFASGEAGVLGWVQEGVATWVRLPLPCTASGGEPQQVGRREPQGGAHEANWHALMAGTVVWPRVEIVNSHAGATGLMVDTLLAAGPALRLQGIVVAGTGNASVHQLLEAALLRAQAEGVVVWRASRCGTGHTVGVLPTLLPDSAGLSPVKARIALMLQLLQAGADNGRRAASVTGS